MLLAVATRGLGGSLSPWCFSTLGLVLLIILVSPGLVTGESNYLANDGDDENIGTAPDDAWQTLSRVSATTFQPGDSNLLKRGDPSLYGTTADQPVVSPNSKPSAKRGSRSRVARRGGRTTGRIPSSAVIKKTSVPGGPLSVRVIS
jgi:hypothetical protein